ncbi:MAG: enoyl-CoA hydratase-related protein [Pseudomonadota bacterium]
MSTSSALKVETTETRVTLTLTRPDERNALGFPGDAEAFAAVAAQINADPHIRAVVVRGEGRAFSAGANIKDMRDRTGTFEGEGPALARAYERGVQGILKSMWSIEVPVVAAINGPAMGLGLHLALCCDLRIAVKEAKFGVPFLKLGIVPGDGGAWVVSRVLGPTRAAELMFLSRTITAEEGASWGFLNEVVAPEALADRVEAAVTTLEGQPPQALRLAKKLLRESYKLDFDSLMTLSASSMALVTSTEDHREALSAFFDKRPPSFQGK